MALDATVGGTDSDSYATLAEADTYFGTQRGDPDVYAVAGDWLHASTLDDALEGCMRFAAILIDRYYAFFWPRASDTQALKAPFDSATTDDGIAIANTVIPKQIKQAQFEIARAILLDVTRVEDQEVGLTSLGVDVISLAFDKYDRPQALPPLARVLLSQFGSVQAGGSAREVLRA